MIYREIEIRIPANSQISMGLYGKFLQVLENSSTTKVVMKIEDEEETTLTTGISFKIGEGSNFYRSIIFKNTTGANMDITIAVSDELVTDARLNLQGTINVNNTPDTLASPAAAAPSTSAAVVVAADASNKEVTLQNNGAVDIWIGDSNIDPSANRGYKLVVDASVIWNTAAAIYARTASGTGVLSITVGSKS